MIVYNVCGFTSRFEEEGKQWAADSDFMQPVLIYTMWLLTEFTNDHLDSISHSCFYESCLLLFFASYI